MKAIGISTGPSTHLDHLGILCALLNIPLLVPEEDIYKVGLEFYPNLVLHLCSWNDLSLASLAKEADVLLGCGKFWAATLQSAFEDLYKKRMRFVFCPHGNSDKGRSVFGKDQHPHQDIALYYGQQMLNLLTTTGAHLSIGHLLRTGNYRYRYYLDHRLFYDQIAEEKIFRHLPRTTTKILYAPTWPNKENPSPVFDLSSELIEQLGDGFTLLVKWHPLLEQFYPGPTYHFLERYSQHPQVHFIDDFPAIYPLLQRCDGYIGDFSSIGYDFLLFNRPLYFLPSPAENRGALFDCGMTLPDDFTSLNDYLKKTWKENEELFQNSRKTLYDQSFGEEKEIALLREELIQILQ